MKKIKQVFRMLVVLVFIILTIPAGRSYACSVFCMEKGAQIIVGRNYDWGYDEGLVIVNKRGQAKTALTYWGESTRNLAGWTSKFGSVSFSQYGRDIAFGGMNEAGLTVNELWLDVTEYPATDDRPGLSIDQYLQYILDNYESVDQILESDQKLCVRPTTGDFTKIHFFVVDRYGKAAVIEFIHGKMVFHDSKSTPVKVMTNDPYEVDKEKVVMGNTNVLNDESSFSRFSRAASFLYNKPKRARKMPASAFELLDSIRQVESADPTRFQITFDIGNHVIYFRTARNSKLRYLRLDGFDFSCNTPSLILDMNTDLEGDVTGKFTNYSTQINEDYIKKSWENLGYSSIYTPALELVSHYPESFTCADLLTRSNR